MKVLNYQLVQSVTKRLGIHLDKMLLLEFAHHSRIKYTNTSPPSIDVPIK